MNFTVRYRASSGATATEVVDAVSRGAALASCRQRGLSVISVVEGGGDSAKSSVRIIPSKILIAVGICVALGIVCWFTISSFIFEDSKAKGKTRTPAVKNLPSIRTAQNNSSTDQVPSQQKNTGFRKTALPVPDAVPLTNEVRIASKNVHPADTNATILPPPVFTNVSDQLLAMVATSGTADAPPIPFSDDMEKQFAASLVTPIKILDTDDEKVKALKQAVIDMRAEVKQLMANGQTLRQILTEHQKLARDNSKIRRECLMELRKILDSGDVNGATEYKKKINIALEQMGIAKLNVPVTESDYEEIARAKEQRKLERRLKKEQEQK